MAEDVVLHGWDRFVAIDLSAKGNVVTIAEFCQFKSVFAHEQSLFQTVAQLAVSGVHRYGEVVAGRTIRKHLENLFDDSTCA